MLRFQTVSSSFFNFIYLLEKKAVTKVGLGWEEDGEEGRQEEDTRLYGYKLKDTDGTEPLNPSHQCTEKMSETFLMIKQASKKGNT